MRLFFQLLSFLILYINSFALQTVTLQLEWKHQFEFAGFYAAVEQGYYKDVGLQVEIKEYQNDTNAIDDVISGKSDFGISSSSLIIEKLNGKPVVLLASYFKQNALALAVKKEITNVHELKDKKIMALKWEMDHTSLGAMLKDSNLKPEDYEFVEHDFSVEKFISGEIDAMSVFITSQPYELDTQGVQYNILNPASEGLFSYDMELFTSQKLVDKNPLMIQDFIDATNKGWQYAFEHKEKIIDIIYDKYSKRKSKDSLLYEANKTEEIFKRDLFKIGAVVPELILLNTALYQKLGLIKKQEPIGKILDTYIFQNYLELKQKTSLDTKELNYLQKHGKIRVHNETNWPPYNYNINNKPLGFSIDYFDLIASKLHLDVEYISNKNWNQFLQMTKENTLDVMLNIAKTPNREEFLQFTRPYLITSNTIFTRKNSPAYSKLEQFNGKKVGVVKGYYEEEILKQFYPKIDLETFDDSLDVLKALIYNKVDAIVDDLATINYLSEKHSLLGIQPAFEINDKKFKLDLSMAVNKQNETLYSILQKGSALVNESELIALRKKWFGNTQGVANTINLSAQEIDYLSNKKEIKICIDPNWMPFEKIENGNHVGMTKDYFDYFQSQLPISIKLVPTHSWNDTLQKAKQRECDMLSLAMYTNERAKYLNFTKPYMQVPLVVVTRDNIQFVSDFKSLASKPLGLTAGYAFNEILREKYPYLQIIPVKDIDDGLEKVKNKELYGYIGTLASVGYNLQTKYPGELKIVGKFDETWDLAIGVRNDEPELLTIFDKLVLNLSFEKKNEIFNKWVSVKYEKSVDYENIILILVIASVVIFIILVWNRKLKSLNVELQNSKQKAEVAALAKSNFIANISHEIRTPLNAITGLVFILQKSNLESKQKEYVDKIEVSTNLLLKIINDVLDYSKAEANKITLNDGIVNLDKMIDEIKIVFARSFNEKKLEFHVICNYQPNLIYKGDDTKIFQILLNLISNGLKFTNEGSITLQIDQTEHNKLHFQVKDTGIGLSNEQIQKLFNPFTQADESITRKYGGTGLGLAICKQFVELMGGEIWTTSTQGVGSSFEFTLLLEPIFKDKKETQDLEMKIETSKYNRSTLVPKNQNDLTGFKIKQKPISNENLQNLHTKLVQAIRQKRPLIIKKILDEIFEHHLEATKLTIYKEVQNQISNYEFEKALEILHNEH